MVNGPPQHLVLMVDARRVKAGSGADALLEGYASEEMHPDAGGRRVADAHLADAQDAAALGHTVVDEVAAHLYGAVVLLFRHGRPVEEIAGTMGYLAVDNQGFIEVIVYAHIDNAQLEPVLTAEHVHATAATGEVKHLLPRHFAGAHADTLTLYAVVATEEQVAWMGQRRL